MPYRNDEFGYGEGPVAAEVEVDSTQKQDGEYETPFFFNEEALALGCESLMQLDDFLMQNCKITFATQIIKKCCEI